MPIDNRARIVGFVGETNHVAVIAAAERSLQTFVSVFDAETGVKMGEVRAPWFQKFLLPYLDPVRRELLFARESPDTSGSMENRGVFVLDVPTLQWRRASDWTTYAAVHHPTRPWLLFVGGAPPSSVTIPVVVFDYDAGAEVFRRNLPIWNLPEPVPFFVPGDRVAIPLRGPFADPTKTVSRDVEVWMIGKPATHQLTANGIPIGRYADHVSAGRLGILEQETWTVHVFDAVQGRLVFSQTSSEQATNVRAGVALSGVPWFVSPVISASGRRVIGGRPATLWDVDSGRVIWRSRGPHELAGPADSDKFFQVTERWAYLWRRWFPNKFDVTTLAFRNLETGDLVYRTSERSLPRPRNWNADATLAVAADGVVHALPPLVNWPLLALCQTILALPLVLLWVLLRWRKRRAARRQPAVANS